MQATKRPTGTHKLMHAMPVARPGYPNTHGARGLHSTLVVVSFIIIIIKNEKVIGFGTGAGRPIDCRRVFRFYLNDYGVTKV